MPEGVATDMLDHGGFADGFLYSPLQNGLMDVVAAFLAGFRVLPAAFLWKNPLPSPFGGGVRVFAVQGVGQLDAPSALGEILLVNRLDLPQMVLKGGFERFGKHCDSVIGPLAVPDEDFVAREVDVLDAEAQALHES